MYFFSSYFQVLSQLQNLEVINFGDCLVRTEGAKAIAEVLTRGHKNLVVGTLLESLMHNLLCRLSLFIIKIT